MEIDSLPGHQGLVEGDQLTEPMDPGALESSANPLVHGSLRGGSHAMREVSDLIEL